MLRGVAASGLTAILLATAAAEGHTADVTGMSVSIVAQSGFAGHAFVYAQVTDSTVAHPAPTGPGYQSPYYAQWLREPYGTSSCPWIWAVYVYDRATNLQVNTLPPNAPQPNLGTTTSMCASPGATPVDEPPVAEAAARLDLDLQVTLAPARPVAGSPAVLSAVLSGRLVQDLNLYLNMAIEDWSVRRWSIDFGDGKTAAVAGQPAPQLSISHTYASAGTYDARVVALITGQAQAARFDQYGAVHLVRVPFSVAVGNDTLATARTAPVKTYVPPQGAASVSPALDGATPAGAASFRRVEVLRGALTDLSVRLLVMREGWIRVGATRAGTAHSTLIGWRYNGPPSDAPAGIGTRPGAIGEPSEPLRLQWNQPDRLVGVQLQDYVLPVTLQIQTRFSDGHVALYTIDSTFSVTVDFAAQSG
jgi:hypothetical protein